MPVPEDNKMDAVWKALSDPTRRAILDQLRDGPRTTTNVVDQFPHLTRFAVMKHLDVLRACGLVLTHAEGRKRVNALNAVPLRLIYERWVSRFADLWAAQLTNLKTTLEEEAPKTADSQK